MRFQTKYINSINKDFSKQNKNSIFITSFFLRREKMCLEFETFMWTNWILNKNKIELKLDDEDEDEKMKKCDLIVFFVWGFSLSSAGLSINSEDARAKIN